MLFSSPAKLLQESWARPGAFHLSSDFDLSRCLGHHGHHIIISFRVQILVLGGGMKPVVGWGDRSLERGSHGKVTERRGGMKQRLSSPLL